MDLFKFKILNKINSDKLFQKLKFLLMKNLSNIRMKNIIDLLVFRFNELTPIDVNIYLFNDEGEPLIFIKKQNGKSSSRSFKVKRYIVEDLLKIPKDGKWYKNVSYGGYFRYTPGYMATTDSSNSWENDYDELEKYQKGFEDGYKLGSSGKPYEQPPEDKSEYYKDGYEDGYQEGFKYYEVNNEEYDQGYTDGYNYGLSGEDIDDKTFEDIDPNYYKDGFEVGYDEGYYLYKVQKDAEDAINNDFWETI